MMTSVRQTPMGLTKASRKPKPAKAEPKLKPKPKPEPEEEEEKQDETEYEIDEIRGAKRLHGDSKWMYLIKWTGYTTRWDSWEPELGLPEGLVAEWWATQQPPSLEQAQTQAAQLLAQAQAQVAATQRQLVDAQLDMMD
jgi:outer membrane biosynthesis protein TonB